MISLFRFVKQWLIGEASDTCTTGTHPRPDPNFCHSLSIGTKQKSVGGQELALYSSVPSPFQCRLLALQHVSLGVRSWKYFNQDAEDVGAGAHPAHQVCYLMGSGLADEALPGDQHAYWTVRFFSSFGPQHKPKMFSR